MFSVVQKRGKREYNLLGNRFSEEIAFKFTRVHGGWPGDELAKSIPSRENGILTALSRERNQGQPAWLKSNEETDQFREATNRDKMI